MAEEVQAEAVELTDRDLLEVTIKAVGALYAKLTGEDLVIGHHLGGQIAVINASRDAEAGAKLLAHFAGDPKGYLSPTALMHARPHRQ